MADAKRHFTFDERYQVDTPPEARKANALEFIAYYLDRIDDHLERLAATVEAQGANTLAIAQEMRAIAVKMK